MWTQQLIANMDSAQKQMLGDNPKSWMPVENAGSLDAGCKHQVRYSDAG